LHIAYVRDRTDAHRFGDYPDRSTQPLVKGRAMLYTIAIILIILWALGLVSSYTMGGLIHVLLVIALVVIVVNFFSGRRSV
jgi:hypothetical protein